MREAGDSVEEVMINSRTKGFSSNIRKRFVIGSYSLFVENQDKLFRKAQKVRRLIVNEVKAVLDQYDMILTTAAPTIAPHPEDSVDEALSDTYLIAENHMIIGNFTGYPCMTMPCGFVSNMPIGIHMMAKPYCEQELFNIGSAIEAVTGLKGITAEVKA